MWFFFFFKQKTAYEMRISDWSSDVCSSDLTAMAIDHVDHLGDVTLRQQTIGDVEGDIRVARKKLADHHAAWGRLDNNRDILVVRIDRQIGRASCRERVCQYV